MNKNKGAQMEAARQRKAARQAQRGIYPSVKKAVAILLSQSQYNLQEAAAGAGLSTQVLRDYLGKPTVRAYLRAERKTQIEALCASNANALARIRDEGPPTAAVNAIRTAELIRSELIAEDRHAGTSQRVTPGLVLVIAPAPAVTVDPPRRLAGAKTINEPGAINREVLDVVDVEVDEPASVPRVR